MAYEMAPQKFRDGGANIPESGNGVPDIVDEARGTLSFTRVCNVPTVAFRWARSRTNGPDPDRLPAPTR